MPDPHEFQWLQMHLRAAGNALGPLQAADCRVLAAGEPSTALPDELPTWPATRAQQYRAGRIAAQRALAHCGVTALVRRQPDGTPQWPSGLVGSIAHTDTRAVAVVAPATAVLALGVDIEPDLPLPADAAEMVVTPEDQRAMQALAARLPHAADCVARWVFSAKECVHKALNPLNGAWLELDAVWIDWQLETGARQGLWQPRPRTDEARQAFQNCTPQGYWWCDAQGITTLLVLL